MNEVTNQKENEKEEKLVLLEDANNDGFETKPIKGESPNDRVIEEKFREGGQRKVISLLECIDVKDQAVDKALKVIHEDIDHIFKGMVNNGTKPNVNSEANDFLEKKRRSRSLNYRQNEIESFEKNEELSKIMDDRLDIDTDFKTDLKKEYEPRSALVPKEKMSTLNIFNESDAHHKNSERVKVVESNVNSTNIGKVLRRCQTKPLEEGKEAIGITPKNE